MNVMKLAEKNESLWMMVVSPIVWAAHFLLCYITAAVWCAKYAGAGGSLEPVRWAILVYTAAALAAIGWNGWWGVSRSRLGDETLPHDADTPGDRHRFLGFATALLAGLSGIATIFEGMVALFFNTCE